VPIDADFGQANSAATALPTPAEAPVTATISANPGPPQGPFSQLGGLETIMAQPLTPFHKSIIEARIILDNNTLIFYYLIVMRLSERGQVVSGRSPKIFF
jgi:hypothetical protein